MNRRSAGALGATGLLLALTVIAGASVTRAAWVDTEQTTVTLSSALPRPPVLTPAGCSFTQQSATSWTVSIPLDTHVEYGRAHWQLRNAPGDQALQDSLTALPLAGARLSVNGLSGDAQVLTVWVTAGSEAVSWPSSTQTVRVSPASNTCELQ